MSRRVSVTDRNRVPDAAHCVLPLHRCEVAHIFITRNAKLYPNMEGCIMLLCGAAGYVWLDADAAAVKPHPPALYGCAADVAAAGVAGPRASPLLAAGRPWGLPFASEGTLGSLAVPTRLMSTTSVSCRSNSGSSDVARSQPAGLSTAAVATEGMPDPKQAPVAAPQAQVQKMPTQQASTQQQAPAQQGGWDDDAESPPIPLDPNVKPPGMAFVTAGAAISGRWRLLGHVLGCWRSWHGDWRNQTGAEVRSIHYSSLLPVCVPPCLPPCLPCFAVTAE